MQSLLGCVHLQQQINWCIDEPTLIMLRPNWIEVSQYTSDNNFSDSHGTAVKKYFTKTLFKLFPIWKYEHVENELSERQAEQIWCHISHIWKASSLHELICSAQLGHR